MADKVCGILEHDAEPGIVCYLWLSKSSANARRHHICAVFSHLRQPCTAIRNLIMIFSMLPLSSMHHPFQDPNGVFSIPILCSVQRQARSDAKLCRELVCITVKWMWYNGRDKLFHITSGRINTWKGVNQLQELILLNSIFLFKYIFEIDKSYVFYHFS